MLASWQVSPENVEGEGVASDLVRVIRTITQVQERIKEIARSHEKLATGDLYELYARYQAEREDGRDLLNEMAERFDAQIAEAKKVLATLQADPP